MIPALNAFYELLASGQLEIAHTDQAETSLLTWLKEQLPPGTMFGGWCVREALRLEPHLDGRADAICGDFIVTGRHGHLWGQAPTWQAAWGGALVSCWRTIVWRSLRDQVVARLDELGERAA